MLLHRFSTALGRLRALGGTFLFGLVIALGVSGASAAQSVLVMNEERILRESAVGQHIASRLEVIGAEIQSELEALGAPIEQENERLNAEVSVLSEEAIQQRPDLIQRVQTLQQQAANFEQIRRLRTQELVATERQAMQPVLVILQNVLQEIVNERGADVLLDRSQAVFVSERVDISNTVIERMNQRLTTTPVNRVRAPQQPAQP
ncbi:MAG: OmpH family outer membrane protein [Pseudomonadota bacterium]